MHCLRKCSLDGSCMYGSDNTMVYASGMFMEIRCIKIPLIERVNVGNNPSPGYVL